MKKLPNMLFETGNLFFDKNVDQHKVCKYYLETITGRELASRPSSFYDLGHGIKYFIAVNGYIVILLEVALSDHL